MNLRRLTPVEKPVKEIPKEAPPRPQPTALCASPTSIRGLHFCVTGKVGTLTRDQVSTWLIARGAHFDTSVTPFTHYLIVGNAPGQTKLNDARRKRVPCIGYRDLWAAHG